MSPKDDESLSWKGNRKLFLSDWPKLDLENHWEISFLTLVPLNKDLLCSTNYR